MPKYSVGGTLSTGVYTVVEAETPEQAREIAEGRGAQNICSQCSMQRYSDEKDTEVWRLGDGLEGEVEVTEVLEIDDDDSDE